MFCCIQSLLFRLFLLSVILISPRPSIPCPSLYLSFAVTKIGFFWVREVPRSGFNQVEDPKKKKNNIKTRSSAALCWCERFLLCCNTSPQHDESHLASATEHTHTCSHRWMSLLAPILEQACPRVRVNILLCFRGLQNSPSALKLFLPEATNSTKSSSSFVNRIPSINLVIFLHACPSQGLVDIYG